MSTEPEVTRIVRSWLEEGVTSLPDRVLDRVLDELPATPQRRARRPAWRLQAMTPIRIAAAAAAIGVLAAIVGISPRTAGPGGPNSVGSPSPGPSAVPFPEPGALLPGTYHGTMASGLRGQWTVTVPDGWEQFYEVIWSDVDGESSITTIGGRGSVAFGWWQVANVFRDPCRWKASLADPPVGSAVDDLVHALADQPGRNPSGPTDVTLGGYPAKRIELALASARDPATCDEGVYREFLAPGESLDFPADGTPWNPSFMGRRDVLYVLDVDGTRWLLRTWHDAESSEQHLADLEAILASVRIDPPPPSPSPAA